MEAEMDDLISNLKLMLERFEKVDEIEKNIEQLKTFLDALELKTTSSPKKFGYYKFHFHDLKYKFHKKFGKEELANQHLDVSLKFALYNNPEAQMSSNNSSFTAQVTQEEIQEKTRSEGNAIANEEFRNTYVTINKDDIIRNTIRKINNGEYEIMFLQHFEVRPKNMNDYKYYIRTHLSLTNIINDILANIEPIQNNNQNNNAIDIENMELLKLKLIENRKIVHEKFMKSILEMNEVDIEAFFFDKDSTPEVIDSCYRKHSLYFHPDKNRDLPSYHIQVEVYKRLNKAKSNLISIKYNGKYQIEDYYNDAITLITYAKDYYYAANKLWPKITKLSINDINNVDPSIFSNLSKNYFHQAYDKIKIACGIADRNEMFQDMFTCRVYSAGCLYMSEKNYLESQLMVMSCSYLCEKYNEQFNTNHKQIASEMLQSIRMRNVEDVLEKLKSPLIENTSANKEAEEVNNRDIYTQTKSEIKNSCSVFNQIIKFDHQLLKFESEKTPVKNIIVTNRDKGLTKGVVIAPMAVSCLWQATKLSMTAYNAFRLTQAGGTLISCFIPTIAPLFFLVGSLVSVVTLGVSIHKNWKVIKSSLNVLEVRQKLDDILLRAQIKHAENKFKEFFEILSEVFVDDNSLIIMRFVKSGEPITNVKRFDIDVEQIKYKMHTFGFRPEGIAQLLLLLFEALLSYNEPEDFRKMGINETQRNSKALELLDAIIINPIDGDELNINLEKIADDLDNRLNKHRRNALFESGFIDKLRNKFSRFVDLYKTGGTINDSLIKECEDSSFRSRLNEVRSIALINKFMYTILYERDERLATIYIEQLKTLLNKEYEHVTYAHLRFEVLRDYIWLFSTNPELMDTIYKDNDNDQNNSSNDQQQNQPEAISSKVELLLQEAAKFESEATNSLPVERIIKWSMAKLKYNEVLSLLKKENLNEVQNLKTRVLFAHTKCCLELAQYSQVNEFLKNNKDNENIFSKMEYWVLSSIMFRRSSNDYEKAHLCLQEASKIPNIKPNKAIIKENKLVDNLMKYANTSDYVSSLRSDIQPHMSVDYSEEFYQRRRSDRKIYKILSIDGGGIRGIIPAIWLREIEMELKKPISSVFDCIAGTSTGAIIGAALTLPESDKSTKPLYTAETVVNLYYKEASRIFQNKTPKILNIFTPHNSNQIRSDLFTQYFKDFRIERSVTDLVIPAILESNIRKTFTFTSFGAKRVEAKNFRYYDALMSTTAAPTYFPAHSIENFGVFHDGGLAVNNPAEIACTKVKMYENYNKDQLFTLSLGTGSYIPEATFNEHNTKRGWPSWLLNLHNYTMCPHEGDTDERMKQEYGNERYKRWQIFTEHEIALDICDEQSLNNLVESARQYVEELKADDSRSFNKLIETLDN